MLVTQPAFNLVYRVNSEMQITCLVQSFNMITIKEIHAAFEENKVFLLTIKDMEFEEHLLNQMKIVYS